MRLRIVHQLSLLLLAAVLLAVAAIGGVVAWNLKTGFSDYLRSRDGQQLERFARLVAQRAAADPSFESLRGGRGGMRSLVDEFLRAEGLPVPSDPRPQAREGPPPVRGDFPPVGNGRPPPRDGAMRPFPRDPPPIQGDAPPPPEEGTAPRPRSGEQPRPPAGMDTGIQRRLQIVDLERRPIAGPPQPPSQPMLEEPVLVNGATVAYVRMPVPLELQSVDARFLRRQYLGLAAAGALTLALALIAAWLVARRFSRPLRELQTATQRIAQGRPHVPVPPAGAEEVAQLIEDVNRMAASLQSLEAARRAWVAQISHELRTPLAVLRGEIESIEDGARQPTPELMHNLRDEVMQLVRLVNDLHTLSMADLGALPCEFTDGDATAAVARAVRRFEPRAQKAGLALELLAEPQAVRARWDFGRIEQLIANLLENSLRYTDAPGRIRVRCVRTGPLFELHVEDSPPGVGPQDMGLLFEPLHRADSARTRRRGAREGEESSGGSGLGLAIARAIVQAHGGRIAAGPSPLGGLAIHVTLALEPENSAVENAAP